MNRRRLLTVIVLSLVAADSGAFNVNYGYPYRGYIYNRGALLGPDPQLELSRIRRELRNQRQLEVQRQRQQQTELNQLRQQTMSKHRISAEQACYYRSTGGFELCADLFPAESAEFTACEALVAQRNPSCNAVESSQPNGEHTPP